MRPYYEDDQVVIYHGDVLDALAGGVEVSFDVVLGDPPYSSGGRSQQTARLCFSKGASADWFLGDNMGVDSYLWWMRAICSQLFTRAPVGAHLYLFTDWRQFGNIVTAAETTRWTLRSTIVWDKARGGAMGAFWRSNHEWIPVFSKGPPRPLAHSSAFNTWTGAKPQGGDHPTVKPSGLLEYILKAAGSEVGVLDPWAGTGTTLRAAKDLGMKATGFEIEERFCEIAALRCAQERLAL